MQVVPCRVLQTRRETPDTVTLTIEAPRGFSYQPGQFNMLYAFAVGEVPVSISGDPSATDKLVHTIKGVGAVSAALCRLRKGDSLGLRGPFGRPWPVREIEGEDVLMIAGGLGLAPLRPVVYHLLQQRARYGAVALLVGARTPQDLLFANELERLKRRRALQVLSTVDRAAGDWRGRVGVVPALIAESALDATRTVALLCGPEVMMRFTVRELMRRGLPDHRIVVSLERNMKCAVGFCGHCQYGPSFVCKDGPVFRFDRIAPHFWLREI